MQRIVLTVGLMTLWAAPVLAQPKLVPPSPMEIQTGRRSDQGRVDVPSRTEVEPLSLPMPMETIPSTVPPTRDYEVAPMTTYPSRVTPAPKVTQPTETYPAPSYETPVEVAPTYSGPSTYSAPSVIHSAPSYSQPVMSSPVAAEGCGCNGGMVQQGYTAPIVGAYGYGMNSSAPNAYLPNDSGFYTHAYQGGAWSAGQHVRHPYYSYRHSWFTPGPASQNVTIVW